MATIGGNVLATPTTTKNATTSNYTSIINFAGTPFLPDVYETQVHTYGNRMITGFLQMVSAEYALQSSKINWTEEGRLELRYDGVGRSGETFTANGHQLRVGQKIKLKDAAGLSFSALVNTTPSANTFTAKSYTAETSSDNGFPSLATDGITVIVVGSEFKKGDGGMEGSLEKAYTDRTNNPIIMKDKYSVSGSDAAQIGWIEVTSEDGGSNGYLWYIQSEIDTRNRFLNSLEKELLEGVPAAENSPAADDLDGINGHEGLFHVLDSRGNTLSGGFNDEGSAADGRSDFDQIVKRLDAQGNIMENQLYLNRDESLAIDNILASQNGGGIGGGSMQAGYSDTTFGGGNDGAGTAAANGGSAAAVPATSATFQYGGNWGMFQNSSAMALNLGFVGFMRGSYSFYKTDWKYLNDYTNRGAFTGDLASTIQGVIVPGGSSSVYDEGLNATIKRPMLHVRYRASEGENRKFKNWVTGSVGGVYTSDVDRMDVHYLSERCLVTQAANNFFLMKGA